MWSEEMKNQLLVLSIVLGGVLTALSVPAQAQIPVIRGGAPVFRAPQFRPGGPQPFSTRQSRAAAAARSQGTVVRSSGVVRYPSYTNSVSVWQQPSRRIVVGQRFRLFR